MAFGIYTIHQHRDGERIRVVGPPGWHAVIAPLWAAWEGLWIVGILMIAALAAVLQIAPLAFVTVLIGFGFMASLDGDAIMRAELRLRGWREVGVVEARSLEGAEELYREGRAL